ncbi:hypothetical protein PybrP1_008749 [[Pythium] brassicae (nom. inval.)]|nr:hypothetical protein PybrP1_008749 [[Pythium] brassicae (nom. inval.)]
MTHPQLQASGTAALRELLLALERPKQQLDDAIQIFAQELALAEQPLAAKFLELQPTADALLRAWPEQPGAAGSRWARRESVALFLRTLTALVRAALPGSEALALRIVRERHGAVEKALSWSDKPAIEFAALELLSALAHASGTVARELVRLFNFQSAAFAKLSQRRMKKQEVAPASNDTNDSNRDSEDDEGPPPPAQPTQPSDKQPAFQIREAYVGFVLALTACPDKSVHRFAMKEGGVTASLFKSVDGDSVAMLSHLFAQLSALVLRNVDVDTKTKLVIFNGHCVHQLLPLLQAEDERIARVALDVLCALFVDTDALYVVAPTHALRLFLSKATAAASGSTTDSDEPSRASEQAYAVKVIRNAIVTVGVNEFVRSTHAQTLVVALLTKYPGLLAEYLHALSLQLEPTPGFRWFCVASLVQRLLSCPIDAVAPGLPHESGADVPAWCSSAALATRLVLPLSCRKELSRGIQHPNSLIVYNTLGVMEAALRRFQCVVSLAGDARALSPADLESELRFLVPSPEALVSLLLKLCASTEPVALIYVRALVVFRLYLECLSQAMSEVKLDVTKILAWGVVDSGAGSVSGAAAPRTAVASLISSEVLRFLLVVDTSRLHVLLPPPTPFKSSTAGDKNSDSAAPRSKLLQLLLLFVQTPSPPIRRLCAQVLKRTLLASGVFGSDAGSKDSVGGEGRSSEEIGVWLDGLRCGGATCAEFVERLVQQVLTDPFAYLETYHRARSCAGPSASEEPLTLSPGTIALVEFFNSRAAALNNASSALTAYRTDAGIVVFGTRVLLSLLSTAEAPRQLVSLIASPAPSEPSGEGSDSESDDAAAEKKRKRVTDDGDSDDGDRAADAYDLLVRYCASLNDSPDGRNGKKPKPALKKRKASRESGLVKKWTVATTRRAFASQLFATPPSEFVASWEQIVENGVQVDGSFNVVYHYLGSWVGGNLLDIVQDATVRGKKCSSSTPPSSKKKTKAKAEGSLVTARFQMELPLSTVMQSVLFTVSSTTTRQDVERVAAMLEQRIGSGALDAVTAARLCEQLLFSLSHHRHSRNDDDASEEEVQALCGLLLRLLSFVIVSSKSVESAPLSWQIGRILTKLRSAAYSASSRDTASSTLGRKLSALEIVSLRLFYSDDVALLDDVSAVSTLKRSGIPSVALLASLLPVDLRIRLLHELLRSGSTTTASVQGVVLQHVLRSLDVDAPAAYAPFAEYKKRNVLARRLWRLLEQAAPTASCSSSASLHSSIFSVLGKLGGVQADAAHRAIGATLVPIIVHAASARGHELGGVSLPVMLRRIVVSIRSDSSSRSSSSRVLGSIARDLESALVQAVRKASAAASGDKALSFALLSAVYDVFTRVESLELLSYASSLTEKCFAGVMAEEGSGVDGSVRLSFLRHVLLEREDSAVGHLAPVLSTVFTNLSKQHPDGKVLSGTQQAALLLAMRSSSVLSVQSKLQETAVVFLVKSGLLAVKALSKKPENASAIAETERFLATVAAVVDGFVSSVNATTLRAILQTLGPQFTRAQDFDLSSAASYVGFAKLSGVFLKLSLADAAVREAYGYDFGEHLAALTENPLFVPCLDDPTDPVARLALLRAVYWLVELSGVYERQLFKVLLGVYSMSLSVFDRILRVLFDKFDENAGVSLAQFGFRFGASSTTIVTTAEDSKAASQARADLVDDSVWVIGGGLEQARIRATVDFFPLDRAVATTSDLSLLSFDCSATESAEDRVAGDGERKETEKRSLAYDPAFLLPMLAHFTSSSDLPDAAVVQQGLLGLAVRATSSNAECIRAYAYGVVAHVHESLASESPEFKAGRQVHLLLESFRNAVEAPLATVPSVVTVFLNDAVSIVCRPVHAMYPHVNHFLLARPAIDLGDVPMFYSLFNSRAPLTYKQERSWLLHTLRRGVRGDADVVLLVRRHVLSIFMSFFNSELADEHTQGLVAQILRACLGTASGAAHLLAKAAIFEWLGSLLLRHRGAADRKLLLLLSDLFEDALKASHRLHDELDSAQQHALSLQIVNAFEALCASVCAARTSATLSATLARVSELVVCGAKSACSLATLQQVVEAVGSSAAHVASASDERASSVLRCMEAVVSASLLQHPEMHRRRFHEWAKLLRSIGDVLVALLGSDETATAPVSSVELRWRAKATLRTLKAVLDEAPSLKQAVLATATLSYAALA